MNNIFSGLHVGLRALETQRKSLDVTGHNISNANNEDYNKQRAIHKASYPYTAPGLSNHGGAGQFGTGVEIEQVERVKDQFINSQIFKENQSSAYWDEMERGLEKVEYIMNEPSDSGIDTATNQFWNSLQDLSNNPSDNAARNMVRENAYNLIDSFQSVENQLKGYKESINDNLANAVTDINQLSTKIADLNKQIVSVKGSGQNPNDLLDQRDALFKEMNQMLNVQAREDAQGNLIVSTNGMQLVNGSDAYNLEIEPGEPGKFNDQIIHSRTGTEIKPTNGKVAAWQEMRDEKLDFYSGRLNKLAATMVEEFNTQHKKGYDANGVDGENFFQPVSENSTESVISQLDLTAAIKDLDTGLDKIAAGNKNIDSFVEIDTLGNDLSGNYQVEVTEGATADEFELKISDSDGNQVYPATAGDSVTVNAGDPVNLEVDADGNIYTQGDNTAASTDDFTLTFTDTGKKNISLNKSIGNGENANALGNIFNSDSVIEGTSLEGYFRTIVTSVGAESSRAQKMKNNQDAVLKQLDTLDRSVSGVSLDEEMAKLIKYQQSYNAAAKYITKTEELLDSLMTIV
ncbi:flagellar hook-associated protein 1 FlgK [Halanaerobium saccharolyticum]|uniref:Flagellar hook-associated protein 1 n=1 Tax=Halanaerobium saccharolyticum TaxID=43595 RepID=A0A4V3CWB2_9FIRM|nr:flagellar hook-associated protein FlgK [Halanaerobium saccharolyticum]TDP85648.1 flagellar hook-associated protein 1 FlgK [Halanaerobium saccharolyticum]